MKHPLILIRILAILLSLGTVCISAQAPEKPSPKNPSADQTKDETGLVKMTPEDQKVWADLTRQILETSKMIEVNRPQAQAAELFLSNFRAIGSQLDATTQTRLALAFRICAEKGLDPRKIEVTPEGIRYALPREEAPKKPD